VKVLTYVIVPFGSKKPSGESQAEVLFLHNFTTAEESGEKMLASDDYANAEEQLNKAGELIARANRNFPHVRERWRLTTSMGRLRAGVQKYDEAEEYYKKALALLRNVDNEAPEIAVTLAYVGNMYVAQKRYDLARENLTRAVTVYRKNFKEAGSGNPAAQNLYGRAMVYLSATLSKLASRQNDQKDAAKHCRTVLEFQSFLSTTDHDSFVSGCQQVIWNTGSGKSI
jgi:tetratricopeptide (TPR) repeat protein